MRRSSWVKRLCAYQDSFLRRCKPFFSVFRSNIETPFLDPVSDILSSEFKATLRCRDMWIYVRSCTARSTRMAAPKAEIPQKKQKTRNQKPRKRDNQKDRYWKWQKKVGIALVFWWLVSNLLCVKEYKTPSESYTKSPEIGGTFATTTYIHKFCCVCITSRRN